MKVSRLAKSTITGHPKMRLNTIQNNENAEYSHSLIRLPDLTPPSFKEGQKYVIAAEVMYVQREVTI